MKAFFKLKGALGLNIPKVDSCLHIFDHTIKPILLYGSEVWGTYNIDPMKDQRDNSFEIEKKYSKLDGEILCLKFYKYILGVHKKSCNIAVVGELGRTPLYVDVIYFLLKYFDRIKNMEDSHLLKQGLFTSMKIHEGNGSSWFSVIEKILKCLNISIDNFDLSTVKNILIDRYMRFWKHSLVDNACNKKGKLCTYFDFKNIFKKESYLSQVKNFNHRMCMSKFRISFHNLAIERDRYKKIDKKNRICLICWDSKTVEDEYHFLMECPLYSNEREKVFVTSISNCANFSDLSEKNLYGYFQMNVNRSIYLFPNLLVRVLK